MTNFEYFKKIYTAREFAEYFVILDILREVKNINIAMSMSRLPKYQKRIEEIEKWLESEVE